jgi:hypothetical protein
MRSLSRSSWVLALALLGGAACAQALEVPWKPIGPAATPPPGASAKAAASDPTGDTFTSGRHDITRLSADVVGSNLVVTVSFVGTVSPADSGRTDALYGFIDIDTDGNSTETRSNVADYCAAQTAPIGTDYFVFLFGGSTSSTPVFAGANVADGVTVSGNSATAYSSNSVTINIPLTSIGAGTAPIRIAAALGDDTYATDCAPNGVALTASAATQGPPVQVTGTTSAGSTLTIRSPVAGVRYDWDFDGDGVTDRTGSSSSLNVTYPGAYSGNVSVLTTDANGNRTISNMTLATSSAKLVASLNGSATQGCGDGDASPEPGETWQIPVRVTNSGNAAAAADGSVLFSAADRVGAATAGQAIDGKLVVQTPLVTVGALAPGASTNALVTVTFATTASCGTTLGVLASGGVDGSSSSLSNTTLTNFTLPGTCQVYTGSCGLTADAKALVTPRQGLYFNPNRPGNGLSNFVIPVSGGAPIFFGAWFTGAADHTPTWYVIQGTLVGNTVVAPIYRFTRNLAATTFTVNSTVVGQGIVTLKGTEQIAFLWQIGTKSGIEFMSYLTPGAAASPNRTGAWYNANEAGWGQVVHSFSSGGQNNLFVVDYLYDGAGEPRWVLSQATEAQLATGAAHSTFQVHCPGCPWIADWNSLPLSSGNGSEQFFTATSGQTSTSFTFPVPLAGSWVRTNLPLTLLTSPQ